MTYRVALTYHPDVGTFRGKRGAWRVHRSTPYEMPNVPVIYTGEDLGRTPVLVLPTCRQFRRGTFVNPTKILKEYQSTKRSST